jgi:poly(hydroxyalkanoate) granule-associated protein
MNMATRTRKKQATTSRIGAATAAAQEQLLNTVHQIWLAGLGAVSRAQSGAPKLFEELVKEGARVHAAGSKAAEKTVQSVMSGAQTAIQERVSGVREKASDTLENLEKMFQTRVQRALQQIGVPSNREIDKLSAQVKVLNANIDKLSRKRGTSGNGRRRSARASSAAAH